MLLQLAALALLSTEAARALAVPAGDPQPPAHLVSYDLNYTSNLPATSRYEHVHTVAALGGLANRHAPRLFTPLLVTGGEISIQAGVEADTFWRGYLTQSGEWLAATTWTNISTLSALVAAFPDVVAKGVVLYDPAVPATSLLASTAAGVEGLLPVCYRPGEANSVYEQLVGGGPKLLVTLNLAGKFVAADGVTAKILAYRWYAFSTSPLLCFSNKLRIH